MPKKKIIVNLKISKLYKDMICDNNNTEGGCKISVAQFLYPI